MGMYMNWKSSIITGWLFLGAGLLFTSPLMAQVATPVIDPTAEQSYSLNPAVLIWSAPSRIHLSYFNGRNTPIKPAGGNTLIEGSVAGLALVGETLALSIEGRKVEEERIGPNLSEVGSNAALSLNLGDWIGLGVGRGRSSTSGNDHRTSDLYGVSFKLSDSFFLGGAHGIETLRTKSWGDTERTRSNVGAGFRFVATGSILRLEYLRAIAEEANFPALNANPAQKREALSEDQVHLEILKGGFLFGFHYRDLRVTHATAGVETSEFAWRYKLGWVPMEGFALVAMAETRDWRNETTSSTQSRTRQRLGIAYQF